MAVSLGGDIAIVIGVVVLVLASAIGIFLLGRRLYRRRKDRQHALLASRDLDLDFDTSDLEFASSRKPTRGHARGLSDGSAGSGRPLIHGENGWSTPIPSATSFEFDAQSVATMALPNPYYPPSPPPSVPSQQIPPIPPIPPPKDRQQPQPTADYGLTNLVARPSFLTRPRSAPRPSQLRRSRSRAGPDMRSTLLTRMASTRSGRRARSADGGEDDVSPSSLYSQASASTAGYWELEGDLVLNRGEVPPVPPLPLRFQTQPKPARLPEIPTLPPPQSKAQTDAHVGGWRLDLLTNDNTLDSNPFDKEGSEAKELRARLLESIAYPLPSPTQLPVPFAMTSPSNNWFATQFTSHSPSSTSPSPTTAYIYSTHTSHPPVPSHPSEAADAPPKAEGDVTSVRNVQVPRNTPQYDAVQPHQLDVGKSGMVGYQLPANWRVG